MRAEGFILFWHWSCQQPVRLRGQPFVYLLSTGSVISFRYLIYHRLETLNAEVNTNIASNLRLYKSVVQLRHVFQDNPFSLSAESTTFEVGQQCERRTVKLVFP